MDGLALILALVALVVAFNARKAAKVLELALARTATRQRELELDLERLASRRPDVAARDPNAAAPDVEAQQAPSEAVEPASPEPEPELASSSPSVPEVAAAAPAPTGGATLEERLGTRWAVWVGGLALALGGVLLVRYSIEQGVFGPAYGLHSAFCSRCC